MARSDLIIKLIQSGLRGDRGAVRRISETIASDERAKRHEVIALAVEDALRRSRFGIDKPEDALAHNLVLASKPNGAEYVYEKIPKKRLEDLVIPENVRTKLNNLKEEYLRSDLLAAYALAPRNRILLTGAPGNGKTSIAEGLAESLMIPFYTVKYETLVASYLGETASRISALFDFVRTRRCVLFLDEFDAIAKERGDIHDVGEVKRVVSTLLLKIDDLPSHVVIIGASNHPELLDRAVWRRFQLRVEIPRPDMHGINEFVRRFERKSGMAFGGKLHSILAKNGNLSYSEIEELCLSIMRKYVMSLPNKDMQKAIKDTIKDLSDKE